MLLVPWRCFFFFKKKKSYCGSNKSLSLCLYLPNLRARFLLCSDTFFPSSIVAEAVFYKTQVEYVTFLIKSLFVTCVASGGTAMDKSPNFPLDCPTQMNALLFITVTWKWIGSVINKWVAWWILNSGSTLVIFIHNGWKKLEKKKESNIIIFIFLQKCIMKVYKWCYYFI